MAFKVQYLQIFSILQFVLLLIIYIFDTFTKLPSYDYNLFEFCNYANLLYQHWYPNTYCNFMTVFQSTYFFFCAYFWEEASEEYLQFHLKHLLDVSYL